jgi:WD40 repeat protein
MKSILSVLLLLPSVPVYAQQSAPALSLRLKDHLDGENARLLWSDGNAKNLLLLCDIALKGNRLLKFSCSDGRVSTIKMPGSISMTKATSPICFDKNRTLAFLSTGRGRLSIVSLDTETEKVSERQINVKDLPKSEWALHSATKGVISRCAEGSLSVYWAPASAIDKEVVLALDGPVDTYQIATTLGFAGIGLTKHSEGQRKYVCVIHDLKSPTKPIIESYFDDIVYCVKFIEDKGMVAIGSADGTFKLWNLKTRELILSQVHSRGVSSVTVSPDSDWLAYANYTSDLNCSLVDLKEPRVLPFNLNAKGIAQVCFCGNGCLVTIGDSKLNIWNVNDLVKPKP